MNLDKSTKRIAKRVKKGFQGYPQISLAYFGELADCATEVVVGFVPRRSPTSKAGNMATNITSMSSSRSSFQCIHSKR